MNVKPKDKLIFRHVSRNGIVITNGSSGYFLGMVDNKLKCCLNIGKPNNFFHLFEHEISKAYDSETGKEVYSHDIKDNL